MAAAVSRALGALDRLRRLRHREAAHRVWAALAHPDLRRTNVVAAALTVALLIHAMTTASTSTTASALHAIEVDTAPTLDLVRVDLDEPVGAGPGVCVATPSDDAPDCDVAAAVAGAGATTAAPAAEVDAVLATTPAAASTPPARPSVSAASTAPALDPSPPATVPVAAATPPPPPERALAAREPAFAAAIFGAVNAARRVVGLAAFTQNAVLQLAAGRYAAFLLDRGVIDHYLDGEPWTRAARAGYPSPLVGEVLALYATPEPLDATADAQRLVDAWMNSPGHRDALLSKDFPFSEAGFACAVGKDVEGRNLVICAGLIGVP